MTSKNIFHGVRECRQRKKEQSLKILMIGKHGIEKIIFSIVDVVQVFSSCWSFQNIAFSFLKHIAPNHE